MVCEVGQSRQEWRLTHMETIETKVTQDADTPKMAHLGLGYLYDVIPALVSTWWSEEDSEMIWPSRPRTRQKITAYKALQVVLTKHNDTETQYHD